MPARQACILPRLLEALPSVLLYGIQHPESRFTRDFLAVQEILLNERCHGVHDIQTQLIVRIAHRFDRVHREAADEYSEPSKKSGLLLREQIVAPVQGR